MKLNHILPFNQFVPQLTQLHPVTLNLSIQPLILLPRMLQQLHMLLTCILPHIKHMLQLTNFAFLDFQFVLHFLHVAIEFVYIFL